ncbi:MAG TPA: hypothetical protein DCY62_12265 [Thalassospira sp.]|nr:hypothetical protein [Thalassospira sp.]
MIRDTLQQIARTYSVAKSVSDEPSSYVRNTAPKNIKAVLQPVIGPLNFTVEGSKGSHGKPAKCAWIAILSSIETTTPQKGIYPVYLFSTDLQRAYLSLNQGAYFVSEEFGQNNRTISELKRRANLLRSRLKDKIDTSDTFEVDLSDKGFLRKCYCAGHVYGYAYDLNDLPSEDILTEHLFQMVENYQTLLFRGGIDDVEDDIVGSDNPHADDLNERRRYSTHRRLEGRNSRLAKEAKKVHGCTCQCCGFDFEITYGAIGKDYIEAHHLTPISSLEPGINYPMNPKSDFTVLCSNCHRMIHRSIPMLSIEELRSLIQKQANNIKIKKALDTE